MSVVITAEHVGKSYRLGAIAARTLQDDVKRWWARARRRPDPLATVGLDGQPSRAGEFQALRDVSFSVSDGEVLGIIGHNGAGKSTLLKILSQVTAPTRGRITIRGRVASLLEVGTGFHPDLTGRENVFLNGAILGMTKAEIRRRFDEIVAFSECEQFIDTPVKRYSSGMYVRLGFAVAAHLDPEILIVDEVLAVGDAQFQKKCLGKMDDVSRSGRTVLFVSHNMVAVQSLCRRAILLRRGALVAEGTSESVVREYLRDAHGGGQTVAWRTPEEAPGTSALRVKSVTVRSAADRADGLIGMDDSIEVCTEFWTTKPSVDQFLKYRLIDQTGTVVLSTCPPPCPRSAALYRAAFTVPARLLNAGAYSLRLVIVRDENRAVFRQDAIVSFVVVDLEGREHASLSREPGVVRPQLLWTVTEIEDVDSRERIGSLSEAATWR